MLLVFLAIIYTCKYDTKIVSKSENKILKRQRRRALKRCENNGSTEEGNY